MRCRLCREEKPLRKSHIFPEWLYKSLYDKKHHRFNVISTNTKKKRSTRPTGIYEKLFCDQCEGKLGLWEGYARNIFYCTQLGLIEDARKIIFSKVQYAPFKLFQMSLLWRTSITSRPEVPRIDLGRHNERIRMMLLDEQPGKPYEYGVILLLPSIDQNLMQQFMYPPELIPSRIDSHTAYRAIFGGIFWIFIVSNHSKRLSNKSVFLTEDGQLPIFKVGKEALGFMRKLALNFSAAGMLDVGQNSENP